MSDKRVRAVVAGFAALGLAAVIGAVAGWWWLVVTAIAAMIGAVGLVSLNTNLLLRAHRAHYQKVSARAAAQVTSGDAPSDAPDLAHLLRLVQAQFVGRLDSALESVTAAAATLERHVGPTSQADGFAALPHGSTVLLHRLDDATLAQATRALSHGLRVEAVVEDSVDRERLDAAGIGDAVTLVADASDAAYAMTVVLPDRAA